MKVDMRSAPALNYFTGEPNVGGILFVNVNIGDGVVRTIETTVVELSSGVIPGKRPAFSGRKYPDRLYTLRVDEKFRGYVDGQEFILATVRDDNYHGSVVVTV